MVDVQLAPHPFRPPVNGQRDVKTCPAHCQSIPLLGPRFPEAQERACASSVLVECFPELQLRRLRFGWLCGSPTPDPLEPFVGLADEVELWSRGRVTYAP